MKRIGERMSTIEKIKIYGLFYKYNVSLDFSRKCNILVGANGVGKITILKMVECLSNDNYIALSKYTFSSMDVTFVTKKNGTKEITFSREDLFPSKEIIIKEYKEKNIFRDSTGWIESFLSGLEQEKLYYDFVYHLYMDGVDSEFIKRIVFEGNGTGKFGVYYVDALLLQEIKGLIDDLGKDKCVFRDSKIFNLLLDENLSVSKWYSRENKNMFFLNLVPGIVFDETFVPLFRSKTLHWLNEVSDLGENKVEHDEDARLSEAYKKKGMPLELLYNLAYLRSCGRRLNIPNYFFRVDGKVILDFWKYMYTSLNDFTTCILPEHDDENSVILSKQQHCLEYFINGQLFNLNELISYRYYDLNFAKEINEEMAYFCSDIAEGRIGYGSNYLELLEGLKQFFNVDNIEELIDTNEFFMFEDGEDDEEWYAQQCVEQLLPKFYNDEQVRFNLFNYFKPIIAEDFPFDFTKYYNSERVEFEDSDEDKDYYGMCFDFYMEEVEKLTNPKNKSKRIVKFEKRLKEYFPDKDIVVTPAGIRFYTKEKKSKKVVAIQKMASNEINLNEISSGEKKIIFLLAVAYLMDDITVLIDEPELSLSIVWQKMIMEDFMKGNLKNITIATHSPYLVSSEELQENIVYLPEENV